jgi:hypothetical protein
MKTHLGMSRYGASPPYRRFKVAARSYCRLPLLRWSDDLKTEERLHQFVEEEEWHKADCKSCLRIYITGPLNGVKTAAVRQHLAELTKQPATIR